MSSCQSRPKTNEEIDVCEGLDIEQVGVAGVRMANGWIDLAQSQTPDLAPRIVALWNKKASEWCLKEGKKTERLNDKIQANGDDTCAIFDMNGETLKNYCVENHRLNPAKSVTPQCSRNALGDSLYNELNVRYCNENPKENWCACHNLVNKRCGDSPDGAGCRTATLDRTLADDSVMGQSSYDQLNSLNHCRRLMCTTDMFIPSNRPTCPEKFNACGKDFTLRTVKNSDITRHCVLGRGGTEEDLELLGDVPDLDEAFRIQQILTEQDEGAVKRKQARRKEDKYVVISIVMCCMCIIGLITMSRRKIPTMSTST